MTSRFIEQSLSFTALAGLNSDRDAVQHRIASSRAPGVPSPSAASRSRAPGDRSAIEVSDKRQQLRLCAPRMGRIVLVFSPPV